MSGLPGRSNLVFRGFLETMILVILSKQELHGYGIMRMIERETGFWKPSPGSVYPLLNALKYRGLVKCVTKGRRKVYTLTRKGRKLAEQARNVHMQIKEFFNALAQDIYGQPLELFREREKQFLKDLKDSGLLDELRVFFRTVRSLEKEKLVRVRDLFQELNRKIRDELC